MAAALEVTLGEFAGLLERRAEQLAGLDLSAPVRRSLVAARAGLLENFQGQHAPDGTPWLPLRRPRQGKRHRNSTPLPLLDTGLLRASVTAQGARGHVEDVSAAGFVMGSNLEYAAAQQFGATINRPERRRQRPWVFTGPDGRTVFTRRIRAHSVTVPARPFVGWSERMLATCGAIFAEFLEENAVP